MGFLSWLSVFVGAGIGASIRWWLGIGLNHLFPTLPPGTLAANLLGGYLIGVAITWFSLNTAAPPELRLLLVTGMLGGLTTFSTFSGEVVTLLVRGQYAWGVGAALIHLLGSLSCTMLGMQSVRLLAKM